MKKILISLLAPAAALLLTACSGDGEVRQFVTDFAMAVSTGDRATMEKMYPDAALAEALSIEANADSMQVEKADDGTYTVSLGDGKDLIVAKGDDGTYSIKSSHGVFAIPADKEALAKSTGWYDPSLTDAENAVRLSDSLFVDFLSEKAAAQLQEKITVTKNDADVDNFYKKAACTVVVSNATDQELPGDAYSVKADVYVSDVDVWGNVSTWLELTKQLTGKPIPAGGNVEYTFTSDAPGRAPTVNIKCAVTLNPTPDFVVAAYKGTGTEYQDYVNSQK